MRNLISAVAVLLLSTLAYAGELKQVPDSFLNYYFKFRTTMIMFPLAGEGAGGQTSPKPAEKCSRSL